MTWADPTTRLSDLADSRSVATIRLAAGDRCLFAGGAVRDHDEARRIVGAGEETPVYLLEELRAVASWRIGRGRIPLLQGLKRQLGATLLSDAAARIHLDAYEARAGIGLDRAGIQREWDRWGGGSWKRDEYRRRRSEARDAGVPRLDAANYAVMKVREADLRRLRGGMESKAQRRGDTG